MRRENRRRHIDGSLVEAVLFEPLLRHELDVAAEHDIRTAARHIGSYCDLVQSARLRDYRRLLGVVFRVEHAVRYFFVFEQFAELLALLDVGRTDKNRLTAVVAFFDVRNDGAQLALLRSEQQVVFVYTPARNVGRDSNDVELVYRAELVFLGLSRTRHARKLVVKPKIVLESYRRERLVFRLDTHVLFGFDSLVQTVAVSSAYHKPSRELVDDYYLAVVDYIILVAVHYEVGFERVIDIMVKFGILDSGEILDLEIRFRALDAALGKVDGALLLVYLVIVVLDEWRGCTSRCSFRPCPKL